MGPPGHFQPDSQACHRLAKLLRSRKEGRKMPVLKPTPGSGDLGTGWKSAVCRQVRPQRPCDWQGAGKLAGSWCSKRPPGWREERVQRLFKARGSKG